MHDVGGLSLQDRLDSMQFDMAHPEKHTEPGYFLLSPFKPFANIANFMIFVIFLTIDISLIRLRYTEPHLKRPFRSPLNIGRFPVLPGIGALVTLFLFSHLSTEAMLYGSIILMGGLLVVGVRSRRIYG